MKVRDIVERNFSKMFDRFEARLADQTKNMVAQSNDQSKERIRKAFQRCFLSWGLPIRKRVVWPVKRLVREKEGMKRLIWKLVLISVWILMQNL